MQIVVALSVDKETQCTGKILHGLVPVLVGHLIESSLEM